MSEIPQLLNVAAGGAVLLVCLVVIVRVLWADRRADKRIDRYVEALEHRLDAAEVRLEHETVRRRQLEALLIANGINVPPEVPTPACPTKETEHAH